MPYPPGAKNDPRAPWNQREDVECPDCVHGIRTDREGDGTLVQYTCKTCDGEGVISAEQSDEEAKEAAEERRGDELREEGRA